MSKKRVLITGASGYVSSQLLPEFRDRYELVLLDSRKEGRGGLIEDVFEVDLTNPDIDSYRQHFRGVDAIVHNAWINRPGLKSNAPVQWLEDRPPNNVDSYYSERDNLDMAFHIFKLALEENIGRVVMTSSNHAADWYEGTMHEEGTKIIEPETFPKSDNFYGWAKASYEHMGFVFATGRFGSPVENAHIRIGAPRPIDGEKLHTNQMSYRRHLGAYFSPRDLCQLYTKSIETADIKNEDGIPHQVFYGISDNTRAFWSLENAREVVGYAPEDDSEQVFADEIAKYMT
jgi:hypothetical protein